MKKNCTVAVVGSILMLSCSTAGEDTGEGPYGSLLLRTTRNVVTEDREAGTRADRLDDLTGYRLTIDGETVEIPQDGRIDGLMPGEYEVALTDFDPSAYVPAFDDPRYAGSSRAAVASGKTTAVDIELRQANAGLYFVYDPSLEEAGLDNIVPSVGSGDLRLDYAADREGRGYFAPGDLRVSLTDSGQPVDIDGEAFKTLAVEAGQLWKITLTGALSGTGSLSVTAWVEAVTDPTDENEWTAGGDETSTTVVAEGLENRNATVRLSDGTTRAVRFDADGSLTVRSGKIAVLASLEPEGAAAVAIGRRAGGEIRFRYSGGSAAFRDAADGRIPIGIVAELELLRGVLDGSYVQQADLYLGGAEWTPVGPSYSEPFRGDYDGGGHGIHGLAVNRPQENYGGLFGACRDAVITDLTIVSGTVNAKMYAGAVAGRIEGGRVSGCANRAVVTAANSAGGIAGQLMGGAVASDCVNYGVVTATVSVAGGIASNNIQAEIRNCVNEGTVGGRGTLGGIAGNCTGSGIVADCTNRGTVEGRTTLGGIAGTLSSGARAEACVNEGRVEVADNTAGGIAGALGGMAVVSGSRNVGTVKAVGERVEALGGIAGSVSENGVLKDCENRRDGRIEGGYSRVGGIAGRLRKANAEGCTNYADISAEHECVGGVVGENAGYLEFCDNHGDVTGGDMVGGIFGYNGEGGKVRMAFNRGYVAGGEFVGGIGGITWGTVSASLNRGAVTAAGRYAGGVCGSVSGPYSYVVASCNEESVSGAAETGGVCGFMNMNARVQACYAAGSVVGNPAGGVCGAVDDEASTLKGCYWGEPRFGHGKGSRIWVGIGSGAGEALHFADGTAPEGVPVGWPSERDEQWGVNPEGGKGENGLWWKDLGTPGTTDYPELWY